MVYLSILRLFIFFLFLVFNNIKNTIIKLITNNKMIEKNNQFKKSIFQINVLTPKSIEVVAIINKHIQR